MDKENKKKNIKSYAAGYLVAGIIILVIFFLVGYTYAYDEGNFLILLLMLIYGSIPFFVFLFIYSICKRLDIIIHNQNQQ